MAHPLKHAESSARKFGGKTEDYLPIYNWLALIWTVEPLEIFLWEPSLSKRAGSIDRCGTRRGPERSEGRSLVPQRSTRVKPAQRQRCHETSIFCLVDHSARNRLRILLASATRGAG